MRFISDCHSQMIANSQLDNMIKFENGAYETEDKKEIEVIKKCPLFNIKIFEIKEPKVKEKK